MGVEICRSLFANVPAFFLFFKKNNLVLDHNIVMNYSPWVDDISFVYMKNLKKDITSCYKT